LIKVKVKDGEPIEKAIKRFKRICEREGLNKMMRKAEFYEKPSEKRRRKKRDSQREIFKQQRQDEKDKLTINI
jgi:small subunit ribosomal protein S21